MFANMFDQSLSMWRYVANAFAERLPDGSLVLEAEDNHLDEIYMALLAELTAGELRPAALQEMAFVARFLKRLGHHALESARWIDSFSTHGLRSAL